MWVGNEETQLRWNGESLETGVDWDGLERQKGCEGDRDSLGEVGTVG